jgi:hypothetical protein
MTDYAIPEDEQVNPKFVEDLGRIEQALRLRVGYRVHDLRLWIEAHGLVLTGHAYCYYDKQLAQQLLKELSDLDIAENRIIVDLPSAGSSLEAKPAAEHYRTHHRKLQRPDSTHEHQLAVSPSYFYAR